MDRWADQAGGGALSGWLSMYKDRVEPVGRVQIWEGSSSHLDKSVIGWRQQGIRIRYSSAMY